MDQSLWQTLHPFDCTHIHNTSNVNQCCHVGSSAGQCRDWDNFKTPILPETSMTPSRYWKRLCIFGSRAFVPICWMCKQQTAASHSLIERGGHILRRCFAHGWHTRFVPVGSSHRSVTFFTKRWLGTVRSVGRKMWETFQRTSETKTSHVGRILFERDWSGPSERQTFPPQPFVVQKSRLSSKAGVQRWDTYPGPTEWHLIGSSTGLILWLRRDQFR